MRTKIIQLLIIICSCLAVFSCTSEQSIGVEPSQEENVPLEIPMTKGLNGWHPTEIEQRVGSVRLLIIRNGTVTNNILRGGLTEDSTSVVIKELVPTGSVDYFLIANEKDSWNLDSFSPASKVSTSIIKQLVLSFNDRPVVSTHPWDLIPMVNYYEDLTITSDSKAYDQGVEVTSELGDLVRLYAKVSLHIDCVFDNLPSKDPITLKTLGIKSMPKVSFLIPRPYDGSAGFIDCDTTGVIAGSNLTVTATGFSSDFLFYIPEHLVTDTANRTYISAVVALVDDPNPAKDREYKIVLGDSIVRNDNRYMLEDAGIKGLRIGRNTHFKMNVTIESYDQTADRDLTLDVQVVPWETEEVDPNLNQYRLTVTPSMFDLGTSTSFEGTVNVNTNHPDGWNPSTSVPGITITPSSNSFTFTANGSVPDGSIILVKAGNLTKEIKLTR